jgi:hypothetical protein
VGWSAASKTEQTMIERRLATLRGALGFLQLEPCGLADRW